MQGRHQRGASGPPPHLRSVPPISVWPPGCYIHPIMYFKNVAPLLVFGPYFWFLAPPAAKSWRRACKCVWQSTSKRSEPLHISDNSARALVHRNVHGTPKLTIKEPGLAGLARHHSVYHNKIVFTHGFFSTTLSTAIVYHNRGS